MSDEAWDEQAILRAFEEWVWCPADSEVIDTGEFRLTFWPSAWGGAAHVERVGSTRATGELIEEVRGLVRSRGVANVVWSLSPVSRPADLADRLVDLGATVRSECALLSRPVPAGGELDVGRTPGVTVHPVVDVERLTDFRRIGAAVFEQPLPDHETTAAEAARIDPDDPTGCRFVAYVDGTAAGTGAVGFVEPGAAALFGGATLPALRRRGAHRAVLAARARWAHAHGAAVLLVKGRLSTSAPTFVRAGFTAHGQHRELAVLLT